MVGQAGGFVHFPDDFPEGFLFFKLKVTNAFLDCALRHKPVNEGWFLTPQTMGSVNGLFLNGRIPPGIHKEDVVCGFQRDAQTRCLQRRQHDGRTLAGFEGFDGGRPIASRTGQFEDWEIGVTEPDVFLENGQE